MKFRVIENHKGTLPATYSIQRTRGILGIDFWENVDEHGCIGYAHLYNTKRRAIEQAERFQKEVRAKEAQVVWESN